MNNAAKLNWITPGTAGAVFGIAAATLVSSTAFAKRDNYSLVPPPPPTPVLQVPPPPVMLPYSVAMQYQGDPQALMMMSAPPVAVAVIKPKPPQPQPNPRPTGVRPANAPNLNIAYARAHGFGLPRAPYDGAAGPGAAEAFPEISAPALNTWFDASLRWYANHVNAQHFYSELVQQPEQGVRNTAYAAASSMFDDVLPNYVAKVYSAPAPRKAGSSHSWRHSGRHGHRVIAYR